MERKKILHETKVPSMETTHGRQIQGNNDKKVRLKDIARVTIKNPSPLSIATMMYLMADKINNNEP